MATPGSSRIHLIRTIVVFVVSIAALSFVAYDAFREGNSFVFSLLLIFAAITVPEKIGEIARGYEEDRERTEIRTFFADLPVYLADTHDLISFPTRQAGYDHCIRRCEGMTPRVTHVKNTVLRYGLGDTAGQETTDADEVYYKWLEAKTQVAARGDFVVEIISKYLSSDDPVRVYATGLRQRYPRYFSYSTIDDATNPMVQMTLFEFETHKEVLFGWEYPGLDQGRSFLSAQPHVVEYFEKYFAYNFDDKGPQWAEALNKPAT